MTRILDSMCDLVDVTLTLDTAIYAAGDVLSDTASIGGGVKGAGGRSRLTSIVVVDEDDQGVALDVLLFSAPAPLGTFNAVPNITDANARLCLGYVSILTTDYIDLGGVRVAVKGGLDIVCESPTGLLYVATITRGGTPTYTVNGLKLRLGFALQEQTARV